MITSLFNCGVVYGVISMMFFCFVTIIFDAHPKFHGSENEIGEEMEV